MLKHGVPDGPIKIRAIKIVWTMKSRQYPDIGSRCLLWNEAAADVWIWKSTGSWLVCFNKLMVP